ncbi:hypothetical protein CEXT_51 [Caerostris extrusa]|uniref:Uncharacterized protein n=1 Tax=Caerostris extrusa TaxID=172846 RepID=A0AAV4WMK8_CAEEX|nr:hypothetical protein CEXT_51 [Caerostris extrusa]
MPTLLSSKDNRKSYLIGQPLLTSLLLWKSEIVEILGLDSAQPLARCFLVPYQLNGGGKYIGKGLSSFVGMGNDM